MQRQGIGMEFSDGGRGRKRYKIDYPGKNAANEERRHYYDGAMAQPTVRDSADQLKFRNTNLGILLENGGQCKHNVGGGCQLQFLHLCLSSPRVLVISPAN